MSLSNGLIAAWALDEVSGTRTELLSGLPLTDNGSVGSTTGKVYDLAASFSGSNTLSHADHASLDSMRSGIIWVNLGNKATRTILSHSVSTGTNRSLLLRYAATPDRFEFYISGDGVNFTITTADNFGAVSLSTWYMLYFEIDTANDLLRLSVNNGTADTAAHTTGLNASSGTFILGAQETTGSPINFWLGQMGPMMIWNRPLNVSEQATLYNGGDGITIEAALRNTYSISAVNGVAPGISAIYYNYPGAPSGATLSVESPPGTIVFKTHITSAGVGELSFPNGLYGAVGEQMDVVLSAGNLNVIQAR